MNPGDVVPSMTLAQLDNMEMDEYAGVGPDDNEGDPQLSIQSGPTNSVVVSWPFSGSFSYLLQQNSTPYNTNWMTVTNDPIVVNNQFQVSLPMSPTSHMYFRLSSLTISNAISMTNTTVSNITAGASSNKMK